MTDFNRLVASITGQLRSVRLSFGKDVNGHQLSENLLAVRKASSSTSARPKIPAPRRSQFPLLVRYLLTLTPLPRIYLMNVLVRGDPVFLRSSAISDHEAPRLLPALHLRDDKRS